MKKILICATMLLTATSAFSQAEKIKEAKKIASGETPDFAKAVSVIDAALQNPETKNSAEAWYTKGLIYQKQFDFEDDKRFQVPPQTPDVNAQSKAAYEAYKAWLVADSLDAIEAQVNPKRKGKMKYRNDIVKNVAKRKDYLNNYGAILFQQGQASEANKVFLDVTELPQKPMFAGSDKIDPKDSLFINANENYRLTLRNVYSDILAQGDTAKAEKVAITASNKYPSDATFLTQTLQHDLWAGRTEQAKTKLDKAITVNPNSYVYYLVRANINGLQQSTRASADADYQKALSLNPESFEITYAYGDYKKNMGDDFYNEAIDIERKNPARAKECRDEFVKYYKEAADLMEKAKTMKQPTDPGLLENLAKVYTKLRSHFYSMHDNANYNVYDKLMKQTRAEIGY